MGTVLLISHMLITHTGSAQEGVIVTLFAVAPIIAIAALIVSLPISIVVGTPIVAFGAKIMSKRPLATSLAISVLGAVIGGMISLYVTESAISVGRIDFVFVMFAAITATMHVLLVWLLRKSSFFG